MSLLNEVAFSSDGSGAISVWEPKGGTLLMSYKGASVLNPHAMCLLGNDYVLGVEKGKPMIHAWPVNSQEKAQLRLICPGRISAMQASPDTTYIAVTIETKLHVWQISSGRLLATASSHYQPITVVKWSADSNFIITGGEDGNVCVWQLSRLICKQTVAFGIPNSSSKGVTGLTEPLHVKSQHSLPVTHVTLSHLGAKSRVASVSHDRTCKIFDLCSGEDLLTLVLDTRLTCVAFDGAEDNVYIGTSEGPIKSFCLRQVPRTRDHHVQDATGSSDFIGHEKQVTSLSTSITGLTILSSSLDETLKIWHSVSRQCLRTIVHKGPVLGAFLRLVPPAIHDYDFNPKVLLRSFDKSIEGNAELVLELNSSDDTLLSNLLQSSISSSHLQPFTSTHNAPPSNYTEQQRIVSDHTVSTTSPSRRPTKLSAGGKASSGENDATKKFTSGDSTNHFLENDELLSSVESTTASRGGGGVFDADAAQIEIDKLRKINRSLYDFCVKNVLKGVTNGSVGGEGVATVNGGQTRPAKKKKSKGRGIPGEDNQYENQKHKVLGYKGRKKQGKKKSGGSGGGNGGGGAKKLNFDNTRARVSTLQGVINL